MFDTVRIAWLFNPVPITWTSYIPALGQTNFALADGAVLWVVSDTDQEIAIEGPGEGEPTEEGAEIEVPAGFTASRWAEGLDQPIAMAFSPDGRLFVAERGGRVWTLRDTNGDGAADPRVLFVDGLNELRGIAIESDRRIYVSDRGRVSQATDTDGDGRGADLEALVFGLPTGRHQNNGIAVGPDGLLYITLGSTCNDCIEVDPRSASILTLDLDSGELRQYASGLRNPFALTFTPDGDLWATDNGSEPPCATPDELNRIVAERHYGWPYCVSEAAPFGAEREPDLELGLSPDAAGLVWFDSASFPALFRDGLYVALAGTRIGDPQIARQVRFVQLGANGVASVRDFATGFSRPRALAAGRDGALYVADFDLGVIYRIAAASR